MSCSSSSPDTRKPSVSIGYMFDVTASIGAFAAILPTVCCWRQRFGIALTWNEKLERLLGFYFSTRLLVITV